MLISTTRDKVVRSKPMKKIIEYVNERFSDLSKTEEAVNLKTNLIESMTEKYNQLLENGKSEEEAFGIVVYDFGSMSDIKKELGLNNNLSNAIYNEESLSFGFNRFIKNNALFGTFFMLPGFDIVYIFFYVKPQIYRYKYQSCDKFNAVQYCLPFSM